MPRARIKRTKLKGVGLNDDVLCNLISGDLLCNPFVGDEQRRASWEEYRTAILDRIGLDRGFECFCYGSRPAAWWKYDAKVSQPVSIHEEFEWLKAHGKLFPGEEAQYNRLMAAWTPQDAIINSKVQL